MQVFKGKRTYEEFVKTIGNGMKSDTFEFMQGMPNEIGLSYLASINDATIQNKVIKTLKKVDSDMNDLPREDDMYRKLSFFLKVGVLFGKYYDYIKDLSCEALSTLITESHFSLLDEGYYVYLFNDEDLLLSIRNINSGLDKSDIFLAIEQHYDKKPFNLSDKEKLAKFRDNEMERFNANREDFFSDVMRYQDLAIAAMNSMREGLKK